MTDPVHDASLTREAPVASSRGRTALLALSLLYYVQGIPFGLQATALPVLLRDGGASRTWVGLSGVLALPWLLKLAVAPFVERARWERGSYRPVVVRCQALLVATFALAAAFVTPALGPALFVVIFCANAVAATLDIAVDGVAVRVLSGRALGLANVAQVGGYKLGMLTGGGLFLLLDDVPFALRFAGLAAVVAIAVPSSFRLDDRDRGERTADGRASADPSTDRRMLDVSAAGFGTRAPDELANPPTTPRIRELFRATWEAARSADGPLVLAVAATYKLGESMADAMWKPFLIDVGLSATRVGLYVGTYGMAASLFGSLVGGVFVARVGPGRALVVLSTVRALPIAVEWMATFGGWREVQLAIATLAEHAAGGALTVATFAYLMSRVSRGLGAMHFTALATIELLGKSPSGWLAGVVADHFGDPVVFGIAFALSAAFVPVAFAAARASSQVTS